MIEDSLGRLMLPKERKQYGSFVCYPDSTLPDGSKLTYDVLYEFMCSLGVKCAISPLHDSDVHTEESVQRWVKRHEDKKTHKLSAEDEKNKPEIGSTKKAHWHVLFKTGPKYLMGWRKMFAFLGIKAFYVDYDRVVYTRYLCHLDSPEKARYDVGDAVSIGGWDLSPLHDMSKTEQSDYLRKCFELIRKQSITNYFDLVNLCMDMYEEDEHYFETAIASSNQLNFYMQGYVRKLATLPRWHSDDME